MTTSTSAGSGTITLTTTQATRVLRELGWKREVRTDNGIEHVRWSSPDHTAKTSWYRNETAPIMFALCSHVGNGHWKRAE